MRGGAGWGLAAPCGAWCSVARAAPPSDAPVRGSAAGAGASAFGGAATAGAAAKAAPAGVPTTTVAATAIPTTNRRPHRRWERALRMSVPPPSITPSLLPRPAQWPRSVVNLVADAHCQRRSSGSSHALRNRPGHAVHYRPPPGCSMPGDCGGLRYPPDAPPSSSETLRSTSVDPAGRSDTFTPSGARGHTRLRVPLLRRPLRRWTTSGRNYATSQWRGREFRIPCRSSENAGMHRTVARGEFLSSTRRRARDAAGAVITVLRADD